MCTSYVYMYLYIYWSGQRFIDSQKLTVWIAVLQKAPYSGVSALITKTIDRVYKAEVLEHKCSNPYAQLTADMGHSSTLFLVFTNGMPSRLILNVIRHPMENISEFIDLHLGSNVEELPSTTDYLNKTWYSDLPEQTLFVRMD